MFNTLHKVMLDVSRNVGALEARLNRLDGVLRELTGEHRRLQSLLNLALTSEDASVWTQCRSELQLHERWEIEGLYERLDAHGQLEALIARHQHSARAMEAIINEIDTATRGSREWDQALRRLANTFHRHVDEEEAELFHYVEEAIGKEGLEAALCEYDSEKLSRGREP